MTIGERIKKIRTFRGLTQKELGLAIGLEEKGADNRIAQYETNYRIPKKDLLTRIAATLHVNLLNFYSQIPGSAEDIMQTFFWLDEDSIGTINLFQLVSSPGNTSGDTAVRYIDSDDWPTQAPVGIWFRYGLVNEFMQEWLLRMEERKAGTITSEEYFEWKINWPQTADDCGTHEPSIKWRNT